QPHRDQGHRAAGRPRRGDGPADEGRARQARRHPAGGRPASIRYPARRGRQAEPDPAGRRPPRGRLPRRRGARALRGSGSQGDADGVGCDRQGRRGLAQLLHRRQVHQGVRPARGRAEPEDRHAADGGGQHAGLARRHRRDREGDVRRKRDVSTGCGEPHHLGAVGWIRDADAAGRAAIGTVWRGRVMAEMFSTLGVTLGTWNWLIFGFILMALELAAPGVFLFWFGLAALLVGLLSFVVHPSWQAQLLMFAVFALAAVPVWRRLASSHSGASQSNPFLNRRTAALVGREFTLEKPIIDGSGTVRIDDTIWRVAGPDAPAGSRVKVVRVDGANLTVAAA